MEHFPTDTVSTFAFGLIALIWIVTAVTTAAGMLRVPVLADTPPAVDENAPSISVIFAARDEAEKLAGALSTLLAQDYPRYEIIAVNDRSQDATPSILRDFARTSKRLKIIDISELPPGWLGKPHALMRGARAASGEWIVFTDADVHFAPDALRRSVSMADGHGWDHLSLLSGIDMRGFWETSILTYFCIIFLFGNRPWLVSNARSGSYIGIGAFQMVRRSVYEAIGGHQKLAMEVLDDMKLGKLIKRAGFRSGLGIAAEMIWLRWYSGGRNIIRGLTKNMFAAHGFSLPFAVANVAALLALSVAPFAGVFFASGLARIFAAIAALTAVVFHSGAAARAKSSPLYGLTHPIGACVLAWIIVRSTAVTLAQGGIVWRGTFYPIEQLRRGAV